MSIGYRHKILRSGHNFRSEEHTSELQSRPHVVCRLLLEKKKVGKLAKGAASVANTANRIARVANAAGRGLQGLSSLKTGNIVVFFFFNDTATTEIYTLSYTTLFR